MGIVFFQNKENLNKDIVPITNIENVLQLSNNLEVKKQVALKGDLHVIISTKDLFSTLRSEPS